LELGRAEGISCRDSRKVFLKTNKKDLPQAPRSRREVDRAGQWEFLESLQLMPSALPEFQNQIDNWFTICSAISQLIRALPERSRKLRRPFQSLALQASQGASIFNKRRDQDGYFILEVLIDWVIPFIIKEINKVIN